MLSANRVTVWRVEAEAGTVVAEFEWCRSPLEPFRNATFSLTEFPLSIDQLLDAGHTVVLDETSASFFGATTVLAVPVAVAGRLQRMLTVGWSEQIGRAGIEAPRTIIDQTLIDSLYSLTAIVQGSATAALMAERATYDEVTGLANRRLLLFMLDHLLSRLGRSNRGGVAVVFCEISPDTVAADELVVRVARAFQQVTRATDVVGRFDERVLAVLCDDLRDPGEALEVARRLAQVCRRLDEASVLDACFGIGYSNESVATGVLLRRADLATYQARSDGTGAIRVVSS